MQRYPPVVLCRINKTYVLVEYRLWEVSEINLTVNATLYSMNGLRSIYFLTSKLHYVSVALPKDVVTVSYNGAFFPLPT